VHVGFLRKLRSVDDLSDEMTALENAGCERIVVETGHPPGDGTGGLLGTVVERLSDGDTLTVFSLEAVAGSLRELIDLALDLEGRNVRFRSLSEGFDTHGRQRVAIRATLVQLREFKQRVVSRRQSEAASKQDRRVGRPRSLSPNDIESARSLIKQGSSLDDVARKFNVSRATIYRYLENGGG
jgi:DNA invertase Pin-like site-specific DNA recombinase